MLAGTKPSASIMGFVDPLDPDNDTPPSSAFPIEEIAQTFNLAYRWWSTNELFVTTTPWRLDLLPAKDNRSASSSYHRRLGCFFGYPLKDIEYFLSADPPYTQPGELVAEGLFQPEKIAYTTFVPQIHDDSIAGHKRAIERGKANRETIADCAEQWKMPVLDTYADCAYYNALIECLLSYASCRSVEYSDDRRGRIQTTPQDVDQVPQRGAACHLSSSGDKMIYRRGSGR